MPVQQQALRRGLHALGAAHQQRDPEVFLQQGHLLAERGLRHVQAFGGAGHVLHFHHAHEVFELTQIHGIRKSY
ncbi:hypothetical protein D9M69_697340 [compost metagenome]